MKRALAALCEVLFAATVLCGALVFDDRQVVWITLCSTVLCLLPFAISFEKGTTPTVRIVLLSVMVALSVLGRGAFGAIPFFKPVAAVTILCGVYLGTQAGVLCGALSGLLSAMLFGMGPWVPFQMAAWGACGGIGGVLARPLKVHRWLQIPVGAVCGALFSLIMDVWTVVSIDNEFRWPRYVAALASSMPMTGIYAVSNAVFLAAMMLPVHRIMTRLSQKYRL